MERQLSPSEIQVVDHTGSKLWRLHNLYYIVNEAGERVKFAPNWVQEDLFSELWYLNLILKARQLGITTAIDLWLLDDSIFNPNVSGAIVADQETKAKEIFRDKIRYPYDNLPLGLRNARHLVVDAAHGLAFDNGSRITVGVSVRGLTFQNLHVSELGRIARFFPQKAEEIRTGALNTVHAGQCVFIESTAQGMEGLFYEIVNQAMADKAQNRPLTPLSYKLHFYPWYLDERYTLPDQHAATVLITREDMDYFNRLEPEMGIELTAGQRAWYVEKKRVLGETMKQEYPSTEQEAFEASLEGKIFAREMARVRAEGRIVPRIPVIPGEPVNTFWDLGHGDPTAIWFHQRVGVENRLIRYYRNSGYGLAHYLQYMRSHGYVIGRFFLPHDAAHKHLSGDIQGKSVEDHFQEMGVRAGDIVIVPRAENKWNDGIESSRNFLASCYFDAENCAEGIRDLDNYKKDWNEQQGCWRQYPAHDDASHGADSFETGARGFQPFRVRMPRRRRRQLNFRTV